MPPFPACPGRDLIVLVTCVPTLQNFDAIYFGAVGAPDVPDHVTLWGLRLAICQSFD